VRGLFLTQNRSQCDTFRRRTPERMRHPRSVEGVRRRLTVMRKPSRELSANNRSNPSPGPRRLMRTPPRATLSPGRGLLVPVFVGWEQFSKDAGPVPRPAGRNSTNDPGMLMKTKDRLFPPPADCRSAERRRPLSFTCSNPRCYDSFSGHRPQKTK